MSDEDISKIVVGVTSNLPKAVLKLKNDTSGAVAENDIRKLIYFEKHDKIEEANRREVEIKSWDLIYTKQIVQLQNSHFEDLFNKVF